MKIKEKLFVLIQFSCLGLITYVSGGSLQLFAVQVVAFLSFFLGYWAINSKRFSVSIFPTPHTDMNLVKTGAYRYIRHPMYTSLLLVTLALVTAEFSFISIFLWFILLVDLVLKVRYEESLLLREFPEYSKYAENTWRLVPCLW